jgi:single-stranded-DNA-specific exonuclease
MIWKFEDEPSPQQVQVLHNQYDLPQSLAKVLVRRGFDTPEKVQAYFSPDLTSLHDPMLMLGMETAVKRLIKAFQAGEKVLLFGDYDVDGTTAVSLLSLFLDDLRMNFEYYIPDRYQEGYGLSFQGIDHAVEIGATLLVSLDCGIKAVDKVRYARQKGIDCIICDHHTPGPELPPALAILDPRQEGCAYPYKELTGCGVGLKLLQALRLKLRENELADPADPVASYADLVALSIACDIVPITGENRTLAFHGLQKLRTHPLPGIKALMDQAEGERSWDISDLVFFLGPRINSAGRLHHGSAAVEVLRGQTEHLPELAQNLQESNDNRKALDRQITAEALATIDQDPRFPESSTTVLYQEDWHKGIIGIVASRLIETHYRPTVLLTKSDGKLVGSARSVPGFDLYQALDACSDHLVQFGGHKYAAGLTLQEEALSVFAAKFEKVVKARITEAQKQPVLRIEGNLRFPEINHQLVQKIRMMEPFGPGNRKPVFASTNVRVLHCVILKEVHVKWVLEQDSRMIEAIGFNLAEKWHRLKTDHLHIAYQPIFNTWNGRTRIKLRLKDIKHPHEAI